MRRKNGQKERQRKKKMFARALHTSSISIVSWSISHVRILCVSNLIRICLFRIRFLPLLLFFSLFHINFSREYVCYDVRGRCTRYVQCAVIRDVNDEPIHRRSSFISFYFDALVFVVLKLRLTLYFFHSYSSFASSYSLFSIYLAFRLYRRHRLVVFVAEHKKKESLKLATPT